MYRKTYFDINSGYRPNTGYPNDEARQTFKEDSRAIFERLGWEIRRAVEGSGSCDIAVKGKQELYLHPMQFSGVILTEDVSDIEAAIRAERKKLTMCREITGEMPKMEQEIQHIETNREEVNHDEHGRR